MKQLTCEMCGSNDLIKQDGVFVCQSCGCKYSVEEAKKMMVEGTVEVTGTVKVDTSGDSENLYRLGCLALEDGDWKKAEKFFDDALSINAEYAECYLGKLMAELRVRNKEELKDCEVPFDDSNNYKKAIRFGDENLKNELAEYAKRIKNAKEDEASRLRTKYSIISMRNTFSAGHDHTVGLKSNGTVVAVGDNDCGQCDVSDWMDIVAISACDYHTAGLKSDGTVVDTNDDGVSNWTDIISVSAGGAHTVGLKSDGTVVAVGDNDCGQCDVSDWKDIVAISANNSHTVGLKSDGTVVAVGYNEEGQCNVSNWKDIVAISTGSTCTMGLKADEEVVVAGDGNLEEYESYGLDDVAGISAGYTYRSLFSKSMDMTLVIDTLSYGDNRHHLLHHYICPGSIVAVSDAGDFDLIALTSEGNVMFFNKKTIQQTKDIYPSAGSTVLTGIALPPEEDTLEDLLAREKKEKPIRDKAAKEIKEKKEREEKERQERLAKEKQMADYRNRGVCQHCGGELKGLFSKTCTKCGRKKDY